jgi:hypothetical protein
VTYIDVNGRSSLSGGWKLLLETSAAKLSARIGSRAHELIEWR